MLKYQPLRFELEDRSYIPLRKSDGNLGDRPPSHNYYSFNQCNTGCDNGRSLRDEWSLPPELSPALGDVVKARSLSRGEVGEQHNLWFHSGGGHNPNVFKGAGENRNDTHPSASSLSRRVSLAESSADRLASSSVCASPDPDSLPPSKFSSTKEEGDAGGEVDEDEFVDSATNRLYDQMLTHFLDEVGRAVKEIIFLYYLNSGLSVITTSMTIVLNALIMVAKHLSIPKQVITIFAAINMMAKGLEMKFKFSHQAQDLQSCLEEAKLLSAEAEDLLLKCKHSVLEKVEVMEFKMYYAKAFRELAYYVPARDLDVLDDLTNDSAKSKKGDGIEDDDEEPDGEQQELFMDQLRHYSRQLHTATTSLLRAFSISNAACTVLTMITLSINPMIISAGEMKLDRVFVAYLAGINTIVKGFELRFKFEHQKSHLEHNLEKAHVLKTECDQLMIVAEAGKATEVEISSFKRALDDAMEGFAMYMLEGDSDILAMRRVSEMRKKSISSQKSADVHKAGDGGDYAKLPQ